MGIGPDQPHSAAIWWSTRGTARNATPVQTIWTTKCTMAAP